MPKTRFVIEGEALVLYRFPSGSVGLVALADVRSLDPGWEEACHGTWWDRFKYHLRQAPESRREVPEVRVPPGTYLILTNIPCALRQRYGLEDQEGAVLAETPTTLSLCGELLRFNNGAQVRLDDLGEGQSIEVLSLASAHVSLYEEELQLR